MLLCPREILKRCSFKILKGVQGLDQLISTEVQQVILCDFLLVKRLNRLLLSRMRTQIK